MRLPSFNIQTTLLLYFLAGGLWIFFADITYIIGVDAAPIPKDNLLTKLLLELLFVLAGGLLLWIVFRKIKEASNYPYLHFFLHNPNPMWVYDMETLCFLDVNEAACQHYGYSKAEFLAMTIKDIRPQNEIDRLIETVENHSTTFNQSSYWLHQKKDGTIIYVTITGYPFVFQGKKAEMILAFDISKQLEQETSLQAYNAALEQKVQERTAEIAEKNKNLQLVNEELSATIEELNNEREQLAKSQALVAFQQERLIEQSEEKLNSILNSLRNVVYSLKEDGIVITYVSPSIENITGYKAEELYTDANLWFSIVNPADKSIIIEATQALQRGEETDIEYRITAKNKQTIWLKDLAKPTLDSKGKVSRIDGVFSDITHLKSVEEELRQTNQALLEAEALGQTGHWSLDLRTQEVTWSDSLYDLYEIPPEERKSLSIERVVNFVHPEEREQVRKDLMKAIETGKPKAWYDRRIVTANNQEKWIVSKIKVTKNSKGKVVKVFGTVQDVTAYRQLEQAYLQAKQIYDDLVVNLPVLIMRFVQKPNGEEIVEFASPEFWRKLNLTHTSPLVRMEQLYDLLFVEDLASLKTAFAEAIANNSGLSWQGRMRGARQTLWLQIDAQFNKNSQGEFVWDSILQDITFRKNIALQNESLVQQLTRQNADLMQFSYIISHNLRSPLTNILGILSLLQEEKLSVETDHLIKQIGISAHLLDEVIFDISKVLTVKHDAEIEKEWIELDELFGKIQQYLQNQIVAAKATVLVDFTACPRIYSIKTYWQSIFTNLLSNALKYRSLQRTPEISLKVAWEGQNLIVYFEDNGIGINLDLNKNRVFKLYKRFHKNIEGKGMGLFLVKTQVEMLGGEIEIMSEVDKGTTFVIQISKKAIAG
ncbi:MAG TPA: hypothetical protein DCM08_03800 [Microscillaceae bacterium]|jgi:PAS domain S-box-containing protein|nr:hypothetical protein [Microscillaceae bacterium]